MSTLFLQIALLAAVMVLIAITVRKQKVAATPLSQVTYRHELITCAIQHTVNGLVVVDDHWNIKFWNGGAEKMFGWKEEEVLNQNISVIFANVKEYQQMITEPREYVRQQEFIGKHRLSGASFVNEIPIGITLNEFKIQTATHFTCVIKNIRERHELERLHHMEVELLNMGEKIGECGSFLWTVSTQRVIASDYLRVLFNVDDFVTDFDEMMKSIYYEDTQYVRDYLFKAMQDQKDYEFSYRISQANGKPVKVMARGKMFFENGVLHHIGGVVRKLKDDGQNLVA